MFQSSGFSGSGTSGKTDGDAATTVSHDGGAANSLFPFFISMVEAPHDFLRAASRTPTARH